MKHILQSLLLTLSLLLVGVGNVWGETYTITFKTNTSDGSQEIVSSTNVSKVVSGGTQYISGFTSCSKAYYACTSGVKLGTKDVSGTLQFTIAENYRNKIEKITLKSAKYGSDSGTLTISGRNSNGLINMKTGIIPGTDYTHEFTQATTMESIMISTSKNRAYVSEIVIETDVPSSDKIATSLTWSTETADAILSRTNTFPTLTVSPEGLSEITYSSSNPNVATIDRTGQIELKNTGTTKIEAAYAGNDTYAASSATYELTVAQEYTVTFNAGSGNCTTTSSKVKEGKTITLPLATIDIAGWEFLGWSETEIERGTTTPKILTGEYTPEKNIELFAVYQKETDNAVEIWKYVEAKDVSDDGIYAIITGGNHVAFNGVISSGHGQATSGYFKFVDGISKEAPEQTCLLTLHKTGNGFTIYNKDKGFLYAKDDSSGNLDWHSREDSYWLFKNGNWTYDNQTAIMRSYTNNGNTSFRTYASNNANGSVIAFAQLITTGYIYDSNPETDKAVTAVSVKNGPAILYYKPDDQFDDTGVELTVTYDDNSTKDITTGFSNSLDNVTLSSANTSVTFSYGGKESEAVDIYVLPLETITVTSDPKREYTEGEELDLSGMIVTATWGTGEHIITEPVTNYTSSPAHGTTLSEDNTKLSISYTSGSITKTCEITLSVAPLATYTVNFVINSATETRTCKVGGSVGIPSVTVPAGWEFMGWTRNAITNITTHAPEYTLDGENYYCPTESTTTFYAVFRKKDEEHSNKYCGSYLYVITDTQTNRQEYAGSWNSGQFDKSSRSNGAKTIFFFENGYIYYYQNPGTEENPSNLDETKYYIYLNGTQLSREEVAQGQSPKYATLWNVETNEGTINLYSSANDEKYYFAYNLQGSVNPFKTYKESNTSCIRNLYTEEACVYFAKYDYTTDTSDRILDRIEVTTLPKKTTYGTGEDFDPTGMVVTAYYTDETSSIVDLNACTITPRTSLPAETEAVSITYHDKTATIPITMNPLYTITYNTGMGNEMISWTQALYRESTILPSAVLSEEKTNDGWYFLGWSETRSVDYTTAKPSYLTAGTTYIPTQDITLYAVYCMLGEPTLDIYRNYYLDEENKDFTTNSVTLFNGKTYNNFWISPEGTEKSGNSYQGEKYTYIANYLTIDLPLTGVAKLESSYIRATSNSTSIQIKVGKYGETNAWNNPENQTTINSSQGWVLFNTWSKELNGQKIQFDCKGCDIDDLHIRIYTPYYASTLKSLTLDESKDANNLGHEDTYDHVAVKRVLKAEKWNTLCLPFDLKENDIKSQLGNDAEVMELTDIKLKDTGWSLRWSAQTKIAAGNMYMVRVHQDIEQIDVYTNVQVNTMQEPQATEWEDEEGNTMKAQGNYNYITVPKNDGCFVIKDNLFYFVDSKATLKGFRGYLQGVANDGASVHALTFDLSAEEDNIVTHLDNLPRSIDTFMYDICGRKIKHPSRGLYIRNGKKIFIK